jgi:L-rhamnose isomerase/sugar isomerase
VVPRDPFEKVSDASQVNRYTGLAPTVALHIPWDKVDRYADLAKHAVEGGVVLGTTNWNTLQDENYKLGSVTHSDPEIRQNAIDHHFDCVDVMN